MNNNYQQTPTEQHYFVQENLPNATAVLVLGIISIFGCCIYALPGLVLSIIALVLAKSDADQYRQNPTKYSISSYNNLKAGRICASITLSLIIVFALFVFYLIATVGFESLRTNNKFFESL